MDSFLEDDDEERSLGMQNTSRRDNELQNQEYFQQEEEEYENQVQYEEKKDYSLFSFEENESSEKCLNNTANQTQKKGNKSLKQGSSGKKKGLKAPEEKEQIFFEEDDEQEKMKKIPSQHIEVDNFITVEEGQNQEGEDEDELNQKINTKKKNNKQKEKKKKQEIESIEIQDDDQGGEEQKERRIAKKKSKKMDASDSDNNDEDAHEKVEKKSKKKTGYHMTKNEAREETLNNNAFNKKPYLRMHNIEVDRDRIPQQHFLIVEDTEVYFPYKPYPQQEQYMAQVIRSLEQKSNALLQSPTGTGKTLCLLCASLAWLKKKRFQQIDKGEKYPVRLIYSSRTHSQLHQVIKELKDTIYLPKMLVLASRDQYCIKKEFELLTGGLRVNACQKACRGDDPMMFCKYYAKFREEDGVKFQEEIEDIEDLKQSGESWQFCPYFYSRKFRDAVDLLFLPYNYLLDNTSSSPFNLDLNNAILIFDEVNIFLDKELWMTLLLQAHNVQKVAEDGSSLMISNFHLESLDKELAILRDNLSTYANPTDMRRQIEQKKVVKKVLGEEEELVTGFKSNSGMCYQILSVAKSLKAWMGKEISKHKYNNISVQEGSKIFQIMKEHARTGGESNISEIHHFPLKSFGINRQQKKNEVDETEQDDEEGNKNKKAQKNDQKLNPFVDGIDLSNIDKYLDFLSKAIEDMPTQQNYGIDQMQMFFKLVKQLLFIDHQAKIDSEGKTWVDNLINNYKLLTDINPDKQECQLFLQCLDSSQGFSKLSEKNIYNMILTSGTLSPMDSWTAELKVPFPIRLSSTHVIKTQESLLAGIISKGPAGRQLVITYDNRTNTDMIDDLGYCLINLIKYIPNGVLMIFNSSSQFEVCKQRWNYGEQKIMRRLGELKHLVYEPQHSFELAQTMDQYSRLAYTPKGAILFAVCRGKISEGIDFSDELARAVFIIGVPYPPAKEPRVTNKKEYLDAIWNDKTIQGDKLSGKKWYMQQAIRAMNQVNRKYKKNYIIFFKAIGRVIRHKNDWGAVFLCDSRFNQPDIKNEISDWVKVGDALNDFQVFHAALNATMTFFKEKQLTGSTGNLKKKMLLPTSSGFTSTSQLMKNTLFQTQLCKSSQMEQEQNSSKVAIKKAFVIPGSDHRKRQFVNGQDQVQGQGFGFGLKQMKLTDYSKQSSTFSGNNPVNNDSENINQSSNYFLNKDQQGYSQNQNLQFNYPMNDAEIPKMNDTPEEDCPTNSYKININSSNKGNPLLKFKNAQSAQMKLLIEKRKKQKEEEERLNNLQGGGVYINQQEGFPFNEQNQYAEEDQNNKSLPFDSNQSNFNGNNDQVQTNNENQYEEQPFIEGCDEYRQGGENYDDANQQNQYGNNQGQQGQDNYHRFNSSSFNNKSRYGGQNNYGGKNNYGGNNSYGGQNNYGGNNSFGRNNNYGGNNNYQKKYNSNRYNNNNNNYRNNQYNRDNYQNNNNNYSNNNSYSNNRQESNYYQNGNGFRGQSGQNIKQNNLLYNNPYSSYGSCLQQQDQPQEQQSSNFPFKFNLGVPKSESSQSVFKSTQFNDEKETYPEKPKANQPCFICKKIPADRVMNQHCGHSGCYQCFQFKSKKCICGESCSAKDLKRV